MLKFPTFIAITIIFVIVAVVLVLAVDVANLRTLHFFALNYSHFILLSIIELIKRELTKE